MNCHFAESNSLTHRACIGESTQGESLLSHSTYSRISRNFTNTTKPSNFSCALSLFSDSLVAIHRNSCVFLLHFLWPHSCARHRALPRASTYDDTVLVSCPPPRFLCPTACAWYPLQTQTHMHELLFGVARVSLSSLYTPLSFLGLPCLFCLLFFFSSWVVARVCCRQSYL